MKNNKNKEKVATPAFTKYAARQVFDILASNAHSVIEITYNNRNGEKRWGAYEFSLELFNQHTTRSRELCNLVTVIGFHGPMWINAGTVEKMHVRVGSTTYRASHFVEQVSLEDAIAGIDDIFTPAPATRVPLPAPRMHHAPVMGPAPKMYPAPSVDVPHVLAGELAGV